jgi:spore germination protein KC
MKRILKIIICYMMLLSGIVSLTGCFDRRELDTLGIVLGAGLDKGENDGETMLTVQMVNPVGGESSKGGKSSKGGSAGGSSKPFLNISASGSNPNTIIREMQHKMSRRIYVAHSEVIVIGEELAKEGVRNSLDFFARAPEARMTLNVFVAKGKAVDVLDISPEFEKFNSTELMKILRDQTITSSVPIVTEFEFVSNLISKTTSPVAPMVEISEENEQKRLNVTGCAVFKKDKMVGSFDNKQARGLLFVQNKVKSGVFQANIKDAAATIEIRQARTKVKPTLFTDGKMVIDVDVQAMIGLGDQTGTINLADPDNSDKMLKAAKTAIEDEIQSAVDKSKELNADVFGFGEYFNRKYPDQWKNMQSKWDELYKNINVNITAKTRADGSGRLVKPLVPDNS